MAAAKLVTRCPACRTAFRLVADQLRLRQGLVRCGQCDTVFDAREHLIELPAPEPAGSPETAAKAAGSTTAPAPAESTAHEAPVEHAHDEAQHEEAHEESHKAARAPRAPRKRSHADAHADTQAHAVEAAAVPHEATHFDTRPSDDNDDDADESRPAAAPFDPGYDPGYDVPALDAPTVMLYQTQAEADEAVQASNRQAEPEAGTADSDTGEDEDEPSAVFVPGIVEGEEVGLAADAEGAEAERAAGKRSTRPRAGSSTLAATRPQHARRRRCHAHCGHRRYGKCCRHSESGERSIRHQPCRHERCPQRRQR
ncbi:zinc-ribbon domain-containing protein [Cupriavidus sp. D39]|uniref:zinc-ribbon domain-containing protein n=1 Tax=Cupriavidus sp. D39 TaxID=2997877 RepID=UPI003B6348B9